MITPIQIHTTQVGNITRASILRVGALMATNALPSGAILGTLILYSLVNYLWFSSEK